MLSDGAIMPVPDLIFGHVITQFASDFAAAAETLSHILFLRAFLFMNSASGSTGLLIERP